MTRIQQAINILKASAKEFQVEEKPTTRKSAVPKKSKSTRKKSAK